MQLYLTCPFSFSQTYILQNVNPEAYILTANGAIFSWEDDDFIKQFIQTLRQFRITELILVQDSGSAFIQQVINHNHDDTLSVSRKLVDVYLKHRTIITQSRQPDRQLSEHVLLHELQHMQQNQVLMDYLHRSTTAARGILLHSNTHQLITELQNF